MTVFYSLNDRKGSNFVEKLSDRHRRKNPTALESPDLTRSYSAPLRFVARHTLPLLSRFVRNIHSPATSGRRLALLVSGGEGSTTGKYFSDGREIPSSAESYDRQKALDLWNTSAEMTGLPTEL
jgi:hypothetical protein